jgi:ankyrin repeat protein
MEWAMVVYQNGSTGNHDAMNGLPSLTVDSIETTSNLNSALDPFDCIRDGDLAGLQQIIHHDTFHPSTAYDRNGATPLMWAAGGGQMDIVRYLVEECQCDLSQPQKGKRSFAGRTALHWAARNGHLEAVEYLVSTARAESSKQELIEAATQDGTTAFGWACWQRHVAVMEYLCQQGCAIDGVNSFGCSPVLWCSQGVGGNGLKALQWLQSRGCNMKRVNNNGHGVLHKAAQRGQQDIVEWFIKMVLESTKEVNKLLALIGPDTEGYCPSDLAGMEGHSDLAVLLAITEVNVSQKLKVTPKFESPEEFGNHYDQGDRVMENWTWEKYGGLRRMNSNLNKMLSRS